MNCRGTTRRRTRTIPELLDLADAARADYLVAGNKRAGLLSRKRMGNAGILTATAFCHDVLGSGP
jgi:predicted nucleic acid-binding protein